MIVGCIAGQARSEGVATIAAVVAFFAGAVVLKVVSDTFASVRSDCRIKHAVEGRVAGRTGGGVETCQAVVHTGLTYLGSTVVIK